MKQVLFKPHMHPTMKHVTLQRFSLLLLFILSTAAHALPSALSVDPTEAVDTTSMTRVLIETSKGNMVVRLFNDTPFHRDNFLRKVRSGAYDGVLFHRVIPDFMVQAGDSASRHALPGAPLGDTPESESIPAEIRFPQHYHHRGALAMAREDDDVNPQRASSSWQFYIVTGRTFTDGQLDKIQQRLDSTTAGQVQFTPAIRETYRSQGGAPHLDGTYTVFGEVVEGIDVTDDIQFAPRDAANRPLEDIRILHMRVMDEK